MPKFKVPIRVSVAPVQTFEKIVTVEAADRKSVRAAVKEIVGELISKPGWKAIGDAHLGPVQPHRTLYDTYLNEDTLDEWINSDK